MTQNFAIIGTGDGPVFLRGEGPNAGRLEIDVGQLAKKAFASMAMAITNSLLSVTIALMKLTAFTTLPSLMGSITKPLHEANRKLAEYAFQPLAQWAEVLGDENKRITETDKIFEISRGKLLYYPENHGKQALDSLKIAIAPLSAALITANAVAWVAVKPLYLAMYLPGVFADLLLLLPMAASLAVSQLTYQPLKDVAKEMFVAQGEFLGRLPMIF